MLPKYLLISSKKRLFMRYKIRAFLVFLFIFILCVTHGAVSKDQDNAAFPMTIIDSAGREVTLQMPVQRVIVLNTDAAEAVTLLGASDKVVGVSSNILKKSEYLPNLKDKPDVGNWDQINCEVIGEIAKKGDRIIPDIVVIAYSYPDKPYGAAAIAKSLDSFGNISVLGLDFYKQENLTEEVAKLGQVLGRNSQAETYLHWYENARSDVERSVEDLPPTRVFFESAGSEGGTSDLSTFGNTSGIDGLQRIAGGLNIAGRLGMYPKVDWEWVMTENPDVIVRNYKSERLGWDSSQMTELESLRSEIMERPGASNVSAIMNKRVHIFYNEINFGMDSVVGLTYLAKILHPEVGLNPEEVYGEYLSMLGLEIPEGRMFVFPSPEAS